MPNSLIFRRLSTPGQAEDITFYPAQGSFSALAGTVLAGGLVAHQIHLTELAGTITLGGLQASPPPPTPNTLTFRRLSTPGQAEPLTFYPVTANTPTAALSGVVTLGGLIAAQMHLAALEGSLSLGGLESYQIHVSDLNGSMGLGGLASSLIHPSALVGNLSLSGLEAALGHAAPLDGWQSLGGMQFGQLHESALLGLLALGTLQAQQADGVCDLGGSVIPWLAYTGYFDINVPTGATSSVQAAKPESKIVSSRNSLDWVNPVKLKQATAFSFEPSEDVTNDLQAGYATLPKTGTGRDFSLYGLPSLTSQTNLPYQSRMERAGAELCITPLSKRGAGGILQTGSATLLAFTHPPSTGNFRAFVTRNALIAVSVRDIFPIRHGLRLSLSSLFPLYRGYNLKQGNRVVIITPQPPHQTNPNFLTFVAGNWPVNTLIFNRHRPVRIIPLRRIYTVLNTFSLYTLSDQTPLPATSMSLTDGQDAWAWTLSASLGELAAAERVAQTEQGPAIVRAHVNGTDWDFIIADPEGSETPESNDSTIHGRSRTALFEDPYYPPITVSNAEDRLFSQAVGDLFYWNGVSLGVDVTSTVDDWLIPAGLWSYAGTPIAALKRLAEAPGAMLSSTKTGLGFTIDPYYSLPPWNWNDATPYASIPRGYWASHGHRRVTKPNYDLVIVSGDTANGLLVPVQREGSGGVWPAQQVIDRLMTHTTPIRQRGSRILADTGRQAMETITLPIGTEFGLIPKGVLLELQDKVTWRGMVRSVAVSVALVDDGGMDIMQTLEVERHYA